MCATVDIRHKTTRWAWRAWVALASKWGTMLQGNSGINAISWSIEVSTCPEANNCYSKGFHKRASTQRPRSMCKVLPFKKCKARDNTCGMIQLVGINLSPWVKLAPIASYAKIAIRDKVLQRRVKHVWKVPRKSSKVSSLEESRTVCLPILITLQTSHMRSISKADSHQKAHPSMWRTKRLKTLWALTWRIREP